MEKWKAENQAWRQLYKLAEDVRNLAPWQWMREQAVFGVEDAAGGNVHFVSVMGSEGLHFGVSAYPGIQALSRIKNLNEQGIYEYPERLLEIPQIQLSFEDRRHLADHAYQKIRALGLRYRGQNAWPQFRSFRPGYAPWRLQADEMQVMATVLTQLLEVAPKLRSNPDLLAFDDIERYLVRVPAGPGGKTWKDQPRRFRAAPEEKPAASFSELSAARLRKLKRQAVFLEVDFLATRCRTWIRQRNPCQSIWVKGGSDRRQPVQEIVREVIEAAVRLRLPEQSSVREISYFMHTCCAKASISIR
ncbi:MAG: hypothetical protein WAK95_03465 [Desulfobacterales bacterium]